jgi:hypothetical protein
MLVNYFSGSARARSLGIAAQIKTIGEPFLAFAGLRLKSMSFLCGCLQKSTRLCSRKRKSLKTLKIRSFLLGFIL